MPGAFSPDAARRFVPERVIATMCEPQSNGTRPATSLVIERLASVTAQSASARMQTFVPSPEIANGPAPESETMRVSVENVQPSPESTAMLVPFTVTPPVVLAKTLFVEPPPTNSCPLRLTLRTPLV